VTQSDFPTRRARRQAERMQAQSVAIPEPPQAPAAGPSAVAMRPERPLAPRGRATVRRTGPRPDRRGIRQQLSAAGTMTVIAGLFAALALPAYAGGDDAPEPLPAVQAVQAFEVSDAAALSSISRDSYGATSSIEMRTRYFDAIRQANLNAYLASGARDAGDDYPWAAEPHRGQGGGLSPLRYYYRECVDFVAWRLNRDAGSTGAPWRWDWGSLTPGGGNAISWKYAWESHGWATSSQPNPGWVAWFGGANHVAYVSEVHDGGYITIEEYNWGSDHLYHKRKIHKSEVSLFLAPPG